MKRIIVFFLSVCMIMMLAACTSGTSQTASVSDTEAQIYTDGETEGTEADAQAGEAEDARSDSESTSSENTILVAYFSCTGTTEQIAAWIADETGADMYQITPEEPYTEDDLDYNDSASRANQEQADSSARPAISGGAVDMEQYTIIFLGYPIWHGQAPRIISTFLESYDFSGVTIIPFCTSHSSGIGSSAVNLHELCSDTTVWEDGQRFSGDTSEDAVQEWVESLELPQS